MTYISSHSNSYSLNSIGSYAGQSNFLRIGERMFSDRNKRMLLMPLLVLSVLFGNVNVCAQTTVTYTMQTGNFNSLQTEKNNNPPYAGTGNNGATEIQQYANGGSYNNTPGAAAFQTFSTTGAGSGTARTLKVGDRFTVTCYVFSNPSSGGYIGISFRASTTYTNFFSATDASTVARFQLDNTGNWKVYSGSSVVATSSSGPNADRTFSIEITSSNTFNATIGSETFYDLSFGTAGPISSFSIYTFGDSNANSYWKNGSLTNFGHSAGDGLRFGYGLSGSSSSSISGIVSDGINTNSTGTAVVNVVRVGGSSGTSVALSGASTYTGATTVNANATLKLGVSSTASSSGPLGNTTGATSITSGGVLDMNGFSLTSSATEGLTINGTGISSGGALINSSGTGTTWAGTVALGSDASVGGSGNTTLSGVVSGANSLTKVGAGNVTLSNTNTFGGASKSLTIAQGTVSINSFTNALGNSLNTFTLGTSSTSGTLSTTSGTGNVSRSFSVALGGGTLEIAGSGTPTFLSTSGTYTGTLNGEFTVNCSSTGGVQFNLGLSGAGGMTINSSGSGVVTMGASGAVAATYTGDTKITSGTLQLGVANMLPNSSKLLLNGGTFSTGASSGYTETVGTLQLTDNSTIALGTGTHNINFSASNSVAWTAGKTLTITGWTGTALGGTAGRIYLGSSSSGLTQAQLDAITFFGAANTGAQILSTGEIVPNFSETITSSASGNWNSTSTWVGGVVPTSVDNVVIASTHTVTVTADATCKKVNFTGTGGVVSVNNGITLTVSTSVNLDQADQNNAGVISGLGTLTCTSVGVGSGAPTMTANRTTTLTSTISTLTSSGTLTLTSKDVGAKNDPYFYLQSGTFTCTDITTVHPVGSNVAIVSLATGAQTGTLKISGTTPFTLDTDGTNTITLTGGTGATVEYSGTAQTVYNTSYTNLTLSGSGNKTLANFSISGTLSIQGSAVGITTAPTFGASSTLEYKNVGNRTTNAIEWPSASGPSNLIIDNSGSTVTMLGSANRTLSGNLTLTAGTLADAGNTLTVQGNIAGTATHSGAGVISMTGASKTISGATLGNVTLNNASGFSLSGSPTINGALTFTSGKLSLGANTLNLAGTVASMTTTNSITGSTSSNVSITGTGTLGTLVFDQTTAGTTNALSTLTINRSSTGIVNLGSALNLAGDLTVTNGSLRSSGANTLTMAGTTQSITISTTSGGSILGADNSAGNDLTLAIASGSTTTLTGDATSSSDDDKKFFNVTVNSGGTLALSRGILCKYGTFTVNGTLQINSNGYLQATPTAGTAIKPTYGASSLLKYNVGAVYGRGIEWSATSGAGYPNDVQVSNNTSLNVPNTSGAFSTSMSIARDLTIDAGSSMYMDYGAGAASGSLTIGRDISIAGDFSLGDAVGGDLSVGRNWTHTTGTFNANSRAVSFNGATGDQTITNASGETFPYLTINKATSGGVTLSGAVTVSNTLTLTKGVVTTTSSNLLHITNTSAAAVSGGSSASYISGPLRWSVSNGSGGDYKFHVGKSSTYLPLNVNNPTGTSPVITAEAIVANAGGSAGSGLASLSSSEYWSIVNTGSLSAANISLAKASIGSNDGIGSSTTLAGSYTNLGGSVTSTLIASNTVTAGTTVGSLATTTYFVLGVKVAAPTISSFSPSTVYVGTTITITGTDFTNVSAVSIGGVAASSYTVNSATSISAVVAASALSGTISVTTPGGTATSSSSFTFSGYVSAAGSDWNSTSTWLGGALPPASSAVTIDHAVTVNGTVANAPSSVTINSAKSFTFGASGALTATNVTNNGSIIMTAGGTLTIASVGTIANGTNTFTYGAGTVTFSGTGTISGTIEFNNVNIAGGVNFGSGSTINGILSINAGGFVNTNPPTYASSSTLKYNTTGSYGRSAEWSNTSGAGYPNNVQVSNNTTLNVNNGTNVARQMAGNLTVDSGSILSLEGMTIASPTVIGLTVVGNVINNGTITLATSTERLKCVNFTNAGGSTTTLSSNVGGDLELTGNLIDNAIFNSNNRAIFFTGTGSGFQDVSGSGEFNIDYIVSNKSAGSIRMLTNLLVGGPNGGFALTLTGPTDILYLNGYSLTLGTAEVNAQISGTGFIMGGVGSSLTINGTGALGTIRFDQTTPGTTNLLSNFTVNRTSNGTVTLGNELVFSSSAIIDLNSSVLSGSVNFTLPSGATLKSSHTDGLTSSVAVSGTKTYTAGAEYVFSGNTSAPFPSIGSIGNPASITINAAVTLNRDISATSLIVNSSKTLTLPSTADLTVSGTITNAGTISISDGGSLVQTSNGSDANVNTGGTYKVYKTLAATTSSALAGNPARYWYIGSPVSGETAASDVFGNSGTPKLWLHNSNGPIQWQQIFGSGYSGSPVTMTSGRGYLFRSTSETSVVFDQQNINNGTLTLNTLTNTSGSGSSNGYNLISNPYPSTLNWTEFRDANTALATTYWVRTFDPQLNAGNGMKYSAYNASGGQSVNGSTTNEYIAPMQAFWVYAPAGTTSVAFNNGMRSHGTSVLHTLENTARVRFHLTNGTYTDEALVYVNEDAQNTNDTYDSDKIIVASTAYQIYCLEGSKKLSIDGIQNALVKDTVQVGVQIPLAGAYSINATEIGIDEDVFLEDKITGAYQDLKLNPIYSFTSVAGTFHNRFVLHFAPYVPALPGQTAATAIAIPTSNWPQCNNVSTEDQWHAFTATSEAVSIAVSTATTDIVIELQDGTGNVVAQENAVNGIGNETLNFFGLTAGQTYKVGVRNNISSQPTGTYGICVKSLKRGGCDYGAGPYSLCQYYKATWAGSTGVSYTFTFTGTSGPAAGQTFTRTQNSDICVLSTVTPLLPYGSTYDVVISNTYTLTDGAGNTEQVTVPSTSGCQVVTIAQPQTTLSANSSCNNGARFRGAVVSSMPWVCGTNNWRWRFTEVNPLTMQTVGLPIELNRGAASNYLSLGSVLQLQNGKTYAVQTAPLFIYTGTNYQWGPVQYLCIVGAEQGAMQDAEQGVAQGQSKDAMQGPSEGASQENDVLIYSTSGQQIKVWTNSENAELTNATVRIYNSTGSLVHTQRMNSNEMLIDLNAAAGLYIVELGGVKIKIVISPLIP